MLNENVNYTDRRKTERFPLMLGAKAALPNGRYDATLMDISAGGAKFKLEEAPLEPLEPGLSMSIEIPPFGGFFGFIVWIDEDFAGMEFDENHKVTAGLIHDMVAESR